MEPAFRKAGFFYYDLFLITISHVTKRIYCKSTFMRFSACG